MGLEDIRKLKREAGIPKAKKFYQMPKVSKKRQKRMAEDNRPEDVKLDEWFEAIRKKLVGVCQCGCGQPSQKKDDTFYRASICHIFPKAYFKSVATHPLNYVELAFFGGCHTTFDLMGVERWVNMACFDDIKAKVLEMEPYLTPEEKSRKFYKNLMELVNTKD
jgi:hypothetical protein